MAYVNTEIYLNDFDNDDIVDLVCALIDDNDLTKSEISQIRRSIGVQISEPNISSLRIVTTQDQMKFDLIKKHFDDFDYEELEDRLTVDLEELRDICRDDL